jgi:hypothetical protein
LRIIGFLLRLYSYLFHLLLCLFLLGIAFVAITGHQNLNLAMLPFSPQHTLRTVLLLAMAGLLSITLSISRVLKLLFPVWAALVLYWLCYGFLVSPYTFPNAAAFQNALWLIAGAVLALIGALWTLKPRRGRLYS